jgi:hypothetical protein
MEEKLTYQDIVLLNIARARKKVNYEEIKILTGNSFTKKQIFNITDNLQRRNLIKKIGDGFILNIKNIEKIKFILKEKWESNWEGEWINTFNKEVKNA